MRTWALALLVTSYDPTAPLELDARLVGAWFSVLLLWTARGGRSAWLSAAVWGSGLILAWPLATGRSVEGLIVIAGLACVTPVAAPRQRIMTCAAVMLAALSGVLFRAQNTFIYGADLSKLVGQGHLDPLVWVGGAGIAVAGTLALLSMSATARRAWSGWLIVAGCVVLVASALTVSGVLDTATLMTISWGSLAVRIAIWWGFWRLTDRVDWSRPVRWSLAATAVIVALLCEWIVPGYEADVTGKSVVIVESEGGNARRPAVDELGARDSSMFGCLAGVMLQQGAKDVSIVPLDAAADALADADVAVFFNAGGDRVAALRPALRSFVESGGTLSVCADHTNVFRTAESWNEVLEGMGASFAYDSAVAVGKRFYGAMRWAGEPFGRVHGSVMPGIGCSLIVDGHWTPAAVGVTVLRDRWIPGNVYGGHLGGYQWDRGEPVGPCVLSAVRQLGQGRVVLHGDTGAWQNGPLIRDGGRAVPRLLGESRGPVDLILVLIIVTTGAFVAFALTRWIYVASICALLAAGFLTVYPITDPSLVYRDVVLMNDGLACNREGFLETSMCGRVFEACGLTVGTGRESDVDRALVGFATLRGRASEDRVLRRTLDMVAGGARALVLVSQDGFRANRRVLNEIGIRGVRRFLTDDDSEVGPLLDPHAFDFDEPWACLAARGPSCWAASRVLGRGRVTVIGDPFFFSEKEWKGIEGDRLGGRCRIVKHAVLQ